MKADATLRIARWEVTKNAGQLDRRTLAAIGVVLVLVAGLTPLVASEGISLDEGIYRVGVADDSPYHDAVVNDSTFVAVEPDTEAFQRGEIDVLILPGGPPVGAETPKGQAAVSELGSTIRAYNDELMVLEPNRTAAFPVNVSLRYASQNVSAAPSGSGAAESPPATQTPDDGEVALGDSGGGGDDGGGGDGGGSSGDDGNSATDSDGQSAVAPPSVGGGSSLFAADNPGGTPADITPPFPFESLVLAFAFVLPMNFVIQAYASSVLNERINSRGELLLVSPVSRGDIVAGKTLPYLLGMVAIATLTAFGIAGLTPAGGDAPAEIASTVAVSVAAVAPIALLFLACAFVGAMFARSFKELTFVTVALSVLLTSYAFIPAIFTDVHPIAAISPLTLVVRTLGGGGVPLVDYVFSTLPLFLAAGTLFALGAGVYREEDMFTQRSVPLKFLDALDGQISSPRSVATVSALSIPFVFVAELLAVALLFALPVSVSIPALLVAIAVIEEVAKSVGIYAGFAHDRFDRSLRSVAWLGFLSGLGFFLAEKAVAVAQLVGLPELELGRAAFGTVTGLGIEASPLVLVGLLFAPLALHAVTAATTALGASRSRNAYLGSLAVAVLVHVAYNLTVVNFLG
ncbi:ABC transporter permease subunit [Halorussus halobius]|uniref:ABC transporter permease subunit n=1 Tax=Halorussus halobius TaxID=1710537 RepID=UPI00109319A3|nr:ABC transporter permease subunit [Halorussus halobius]